MIFENENNEKQSTCMKKLTMSLFQGMVGRSSLNISVKPNSSMTQLSLSHSIMVLSKSKTSTIPDIFFFCFTFFWATKGEWKKSLNGCLKCQSALKMCSRLGFFTKENMVFIGGWSPTPKTKKTFFWNLNEKFIFDYKGILHWDSILRWLVADKW